MEHALRLLELWVGCLQHQFRLEAFSSRARMTAQQLVRSSLSGRVRHCRGELFWETVSRAAVLHYKDICANDIWARTASASMQGRCPADRSRAATHRVFICKQFTFCLFDCLSNYLDLAFMTSSLPAVKNMIRPCLDLKVDANLVVIAAARAGI